MRIRLLVLLAVVAGCTHTRTPEQNEHSRTWRVAGGDAGQTRYSSLNQINRSNVNRLEAAWTFETGDEGPTIECNPIVIGRVMYLTSPALKVIALDAATGQEIWRFDPFKHYEGPTYWRHVSRGVTYWSDGRNERIFAGAGHHLYSLDARSGELDRQFGDGGKIDLREGLGRKLEDVQMIVTSPGAIYKNLIIVGGNVSESPGAAPGHVRAYDVRSGKLVWTFRTIPAPGEIGYETWEDGSAASSGGANAWAGFSVDEKRGIVYAPTGSATYDFYGGNRKGKNLFANTLLALDAASGKRLWHFQMVHHDVWDRDLPAPPALVQVQRNGRRIDAVAQITKTGFVFVLDRETGEPLFPVHELPVPASDVPGEKAWPTQPVPTSPPPFAKQGISRDDLTDLSPEATAYARGQFDALRSEGLFAPGSREGTLLMPGFLGGGNWSGAAFDRSTGRLYVNANNVPSILRLVPAPDSLRNRPGYPQFIARGYIHFVDEEGFPAVKPPWGTLTAIDLNRGESAWQVPLGTYPELARRGYPPTGTLNLGGAIVTGGGLVFIGSTLDSKFRAFDASTGEVLWEADLPTGGMALPATYEVDGRQYIVIAAGGGTGMRGPRPIETPPGSSYVAFALP